MLDSELRFKGELSDERTCSSFVVEDSSGFVLELEVQGFLEGVSVASSQFLRLPWFESKKRNEVFSLTFSDVNQNGEKEN
jgi:hypothetical protein